MYWFWDKKVSHSRKTEKKKQKDDKKESMFRLSLIPTHGTHMQDNPTTSSCYRTRRKSKPATHRQHFVPSRRKDFLRRVLGWVTFRPGLSSSMAGPTFELDHSSHIYCLPLPVVCHWCSLTAFAGLRNETGETENWAFGQEKSLPTRVPGLDPKPHYVLSYFIQCSFYKWLWNSKSTKIYLEFPSVP